MAVLANALSPTLSQGERESKTMANDKFEMIYGKIRFIFRAYSLTIFSAPPM